MFAYFLKKCDAYGLSPKRQNASGKFGKIENIKVLAACECTGNTVTQGRLLIIFTSWRCKKDIFNLALPTFLGTVKRFV
jgi:hypothetical protein